MSRESEVQTL